LGGGGLDVTTTEAEGRKSVGKFWWLTMIRGIFALSLGISLAVPGIGSEDRILNFMGVYWFTSGVSSITWGVRGARRKGLWLLAGIVGLIGGLVILIRPIAAPIVDAGLFPIAFGILAVLTGLVHIFGGFRLSHDLERKWTWESCILGITEVGLGVIVLASSDAPPPVVLLAAAAWATVGGVGLILLALRLRQLGQGSRQEDGSVGSPTTGEDSTV
jgi:uncharacterized membrane protein HdeD (DUF308 family)